MELYIRIKDGEPVDHPILGDNLRQVFPDLYPENLPAEFVRFERVAFENSGLPALGHFEVAEFSYQFVDGIVKDVWSVREMTSEEREEKIERHRAALEDSRSKLILEAQTERDNASSDDERAIWVEYLSKLESFTYNNPVTALLPFPPQRNYLGQLYSAQIGVTRV